MLSRASEHKSAVIDAVVAQLRERMTKKDAANLEKFVRQYYNDVAPEDLTEFNAETLYGEALSMWRFAQKRKPGEPKIRIYNPRHEDHGWQSTHTPGRSGRGIGRTRLRRPEDQEQDEKISG